MQTHEVTGAVLEDEILGIVVCGVRGEVRVSARRFAKLRAGLQCFLSKRWVARDQVEVFVGHLTFVFLLRRPLLSVLSACYGVIRQMGPRAGIVWPRAREELTASLHLLVLAWADL